jgi:PTH1 family peptidyl-tRNA hydrolase
VPVDAMLVVHDEIDLEPGTIRLKFGGGHGGHNGLQDVITCAGSNFMRLRIGVGHPGFRDAVISYVLNRPGAEDRSLIDSAMDRALKVMPCLFAGQDQRAMTELHTESE